MRGSILDALGYCHLSLGWFEEAPKAFSEYLKIHPSDIGGRFFLASAYASLKWTDEAIQELKKILASDPTDVLARHDLALSYRNKGWLKESLEEMRKANEYAIIYGNAEEKEINARNPVYWAVPRGRIGQALQILGVHIGVHPPGNGVHISV
jgi:tetratricopeptide (TPR) repeat protein